MQKSPALHEEPGGQPAILLTQTDHPGVSLYGFGREHIIARMIDVPLIVELSSSIFDGHNHTGYIALLRAAGDAHFRRREIWRSGVKNGEEGRWHLFLKGKLCHVYGDFFIPGIADGARNNLGLHTLLRLIRYDQGRQVFLSFFGREDHR